MHRIDAQITAQAASYSLLPGYFTIKKGFCKGGLGMFFEKISKDFFSRGARAEDHSPKRAAISLRS